MLPRKVAIVTIHMSGAMRHNKWICKGNRYANRAMQNGGNNNKKKSKNNLAGKAAGNKNKKSKKNPEIEIGSSSRPLNPTQLNQE